MDSLTIAYILVVSIGIISGYAFGTYVENILSSKQNDIYNRTNTPSSFDGGMSKNISSYISNYGSQALPSTMSNVTF